MFALIAAILFIISAIAHAAGWTGHADWLVWALLGLAAFALHHAYAVALPRPGAARQP